MLSIAKLRVGQEAYQLTGVARSLDDYYTGAGEASGWWAGEGAAQLGLTGEVAADDLRTVLAGMAPGSGGLSPNGETIRPHPRRVPGFDLTFKAPKSLSVLYAVSDDPRVQGAIIEACEAAVRATLGWLERDAIRVRRGTANERWLADLAARDPVAAEQARIKVLPARGMAAAVFRHRTSRAGDPLLHWHVLVPNLVEGPDGRWSALVGPELYRHVRAAGELFQAELRAEVTARLGLEWRPGRHVPEVAGVPQALCDRFSKRSQEIEAWLAATGTPDDPAGRQAAVLATRRHKPELEGERFDAAWKAQALAAGWGPDAADALLTGLVPAPERPVEDRWRLPEWTADPETGEPVLVDQLVDPEEWIADLLERDLLARDATFTRPQVAQAVAARLGEGATVATVERLTARVMASSQLLPVRPQDDNDGDQDQAPRLWTSTGQLARELSLLAAAEGSRGVHAPLRPRVVRRAVRRRGLGDDQLAAVRQIAASTDGVMALVGPAGTGKTFAVAAIADAFVRSGGQVYGAAPSARAAVELEAGTNMETFTLHRLLGDWAGGYNLPTADTILVIDEAAMAATTELEPVVSRTVAAGGRVLLVGDHRQLPAVGPGGGFTAIVTDPAATVAQLTVNRRQIAAWEREALRELRDGRVVTAVDAYRTHGRVVVTDDRAAMLTEGVRRWFDAQADGLRAVLLAGTTEMVDSLNAAIRQELIARGVLSDWPLAVAAGKQFTAGDRVVLRRNAYQELDVDRRPIQLINSQAGTVLGRRTDGLVVRLDIAPRRPVVVPDAYLNAGHLDHAYALTTIRTQGGTWDLAIGVGLDGLYREAGYVALSRGSQSNWLVLAQPDIDRVDAELARHQEPQVLPLPGEEPDDIDSELSGRLEQSRAKLLALAQDPHVGHVAHLAEITPLADLETHACYCRAIEAQATRVVGIDPRTAAAVVARAQHTARHLAVGQRVKAHDRHNIGTIVGYDDRAGTVRVHFVSPTKHETTKDLPWQQVQIVVPRQPEPRQLPPEAEARLEDLLTPIREQLERWHAHLAAHGIGPTEARDYERAAELVIDRAAAQLTYAQPDWLQELLGPRPDPALCAHTWTETIREIAAYRTRHQIDPQMPGLGPEPHETSSIRQPWEQVTAQIARTRIWIDTYRNEPALPLTRTRSTAELHQRAQELDDLFATAPPDQRHLLDQITSGQLTLEDTATLLDQALATQDDRRAWILAHWPHIVEHAEITHTLNHRAAGPDLDRLLAQLTQPADTTNSPDQQLDHPSPLLRTLLGHIDPQKVRHLAATAAISDLLAHARHRRQIEDQATHTVGDPRDLDPKATRALHTALHLTPGQRIRAHDRHNIGTILSPKDRTGHATVHFRSPEGYEANVYLNRPGFCGGSICE